MTDPCPVARDSEIPAKRPAQVNIHDIRNSLPINLGTSFSTSLQTFVAAVDICVVFKALHPPEAWGHLQLAGAQDEVQKGPRKRRNRRRGNAEWGMWTG